MDHLGAKVAFAIFFLQILERKTVFERDAIWHLSGAASSDQSSREKFHSYLKS